MPIRGKSEKQIKEIFMENNNVENANNANNLNYDENQIQVLEGMEAVRKRPGMYIGSTGSRGLHHLVYEIVDNAIDEALAGYCDTINVQLLPDDVVRIIDNGRGIPTGIHPTEGISAATLVFTTLHAGGKFGGGGYKVAGGLHGVGAAVVNALSEWLEIEICDGKNKYYQHFERGEYTEPLKEIDKTTRIGSVITFKADYQIFETTEYEYELLQSRLREQAFLNAGVCIILSDLRHEGDERKDVMKYEGGIKSFVEFKHQRKGLENLHPQVIYIHDKQEDTEIEIAMQYNTSFYEAISSFANNINTSEGGTHEIGFKTALTRVLNDYGKRYKIIKDTDKNLSGEDAREGLTAIISVKLTDCEFEGQTKSKLGNTEVRSLVEKMMSTKLVNYLDENPSVAKTILNKSLNAQRVREAMRKARDIERKKSGLESNSLPGKLVDCTEKKSELTEIYIVEGDSAGGSAKGGRDNRYQAILPLWGKMLNVEKARHDKVYGNEKLIPVVTALGCSIGDEFDIERLRYGKVIIMADADVDGSHIRTLLLTFFFRFMKPLVENGRIYIAQPPLYKLTKGKQKYYAYTDKERDELLEKLSAESSTKINVQRWKGLGEMNSSELWETTMNPENRILVKIEMSDAEAADEMFSILMGDKVAPRREFIEANARYAKNLDI